MSGFFPMNMLFGGALAPSRGGDLGASRGGDLGASRGGVLEASLGGLGVSDGLVVSFAASVLGLAAGVSVFSDDIYRIPQLS
jgi:hypothetical protein